MKTILLSFLITFYAVFSNASEILPGKYIGTGFSVEKDGKVVFTDKMIHKFDSELIVKKIGGSSYQFTVNAEVQQKPNSKIIKDRRVDKFDALWRSETEGRLINKNPQYSKDECRFSYNDSILQIDCWIARHSAWEKQTYSQ